MGFRNMQEKLEKVKEFIIIIIFCLMRQQSASTLHCIAYVYAAVVLGWRPGQSSKFQPILATQDTDWFSWELSKKEKKKNPKQIPKWPTLHQSILLTKGPIYKNFEKKYWELVELKNSVFLSRPFLFLFSKKNIFASSPWKSVKVSWAARMDWNFDDFPDFQKNPCYA